MRAGRGCNRESQDLYRDADALDTVAASADYLAGLAGADGEKAKAARISDEADVLRRWATLCRQVAAG